MLDFSQNEAPRSKDPSNKKETLEQLLLARNKKLSNELTVLRVSHQDLTARIQSLQDNLNSVNTELKASRELNVKLEDDLYKLQSEPQSNPFSSGLSVAPSRYAPSMAHGGYGSTRGGRVSPTSSIISGFTPQGGGRGDTLDSLRGEPSSNVGQGILPMVTAQRDRFKQRNQQLEEELSKANTTISSLRQEVSSLQKDNLQLYEKSRYISTYSKSRPSQDAYINIGGAGTSSSSVSAGRDGGLHDRYKAAYEADISPFQAFRGRERARALRKMGLVEKMVYQFARVVLASRLSRNLFAGYCVALHMLVMGMLYYSATGQVDAAVTGPAEAAGHSGSDWVKELPP